MGTPSSRSTAGIAYDRAGPRGDLPIVLVHAGIADRHRDVGDVGDVDPTVRDLVRQMQRRAFEVTAGWDDVDERKLDPPALDRLAEIRVPALVLVGALDLDAVHDAARRVADGITGARRVDWSDVTHLPSMERPMTSSRCWMTG